MKKLKIAFASLLLGTLLLSNCIKDPFTTTGRIRTHVWNGLRTMELEQDNFGHFEMTYKVTQPAIDQVTRNGMSPADSCTVEIGVPVRQTKENGFLQFN